MKCIHIFLSGGKQWCEKLPDIIKNVDPKGIHQYVCCENDLVDANPNDLIIDNRISQYKSGMLHKLKMFEDYANKADYILIYNNILSSLDRSRMPNKILKKIVWISFGSDLNCEHESGFKGEHFISKLYHVALLPIVEKKSRSKMSRIVAIGIGSIIDGFSIRRDYGNVPILPYAFASNRKDGKVLEQVIDDSKQFEGIRIMVGHHGYPGVNHIDVLKRLSCYKNENIIVSLPLVYGDEEYIECVQEYALQVFGDKAEILRDRVSLSEYRKYLSTIDIAVFDTDKYIASGNINSLMIKGVKLFTKRCGKIAEQLQLNNIEVFDSDQIGKISFDEFSEPLSDSNLRSMRRYADSIIINDDEQIKDNSEARIRITLKFLSNRIECRNE